MSLPARAPTQGAVRSPPALLPCPQVKICCISSLDEARLAIAAGAQAVGLVSAMPSGPGVIDERLIAEIAAAVAELSAARPRAAAGQDSAAAPVQTFLLTALQTAAAIVAQHRRCRTTTLQLVVKQLGGTGRTHDWAVSRRIREALDTLGRPLYPAGVTAGSVTEAVAAVQPWGLDLCSSVRSDGRLDAARLAAFFDALAAAGAAALGNLRSQR